jgi:hypothetical protein
LNLQNKVILVILSALVAGLIACGLLIDGMAAVEGFLRLQTAPARLISDFIESQGIGAAFINAALVGAVGLAIIIISKVQLSGPTFAAVFTLIGFGFFGKTPVNIIPIFAGVYLSARFVNKSFQQYILIALFGSALGPLVSFLSFGLGLGHTWGILTGTIAGICVGFILPAISVAMLHLHQGYNLYNVGLSCGFMGLFITAIVRASDSYTASEMIWHSEKSLLLICLVPFISIAFIFTALAIDGLKSLRSMVAIQSHTGRLPSDFMDKESLGGTLINCGLIGLLGSAYVYIVGGDFNGPVIGGLFTIIGFAAFGTHLKNSYPVVLGVLLASFVFSRHLASPGPILAAIFCTTLSPLAGQFGIRIGIIAGFLHLSMVMQTAEWHGGFNLYNNGFAGGLTATFIVSIIQWYKSNKATSQE